MMTAGVSNIKKRVLPNFTFESTLGKRDYFCMNGLIFKIKK